MNLIEFMMAAGLVGALLGAFLIRRQHPSSKKWLIWVGLAVLFLIGILVNYGQ